MSVPYESLAGRERSTQALIDWALAQIAEKYGQGGSEPHPSHDERHTKWVMYAQDLIIEKINDNSGEYGDYIDPHTAELMRLAAVFHDIVHTPGDPDNEEKSARMLAAMVRGAGAYSESEIELAQRILMSTTLKFDEGGQIIQGAEEGFLPGQILADADLSVIGARYPIFWESVGRYLLESKPMGWQFSAEDLVEFADREIKFLDSHQFLTPAAEKLFPHKPTNKFQLARTKIANSKLK